MIDENTTALIGQLKEIQRTANTCCYALVAIAIFTAIVAFR